jgi:hypothetical protein
MTCKDVGLSKSHTARGHTRSSSSGKRQDLRFCMDYRKLNSVTRKDCPGLTAPWTRWQEPNGSTLDLRSGYWQVDLYVDDKGKTLFSTVQVLW